MGKENDVARVGGMLNTGLVVPLGPAWPSCLAGVLKPFFTIIKL
jgi:hypothetical protein